MNPPVIDLIFSFTFTLNLVLNISWIFTWDREEIVTSCAILIFMAITNAVSTFYIAKKISMNNHDLMKSQKKVYWYVYDTTLRSLINVQCTVVELFMEGVTKLFR